MPATIMKRAINQDYLQSLMDFAKSVDLEELVWEQGEQRIAFKRRVAQPAPAIMPDRRAPVPKAEAKPAGPKIHMILSPMVGTFLRSAKDRPPLVVEGDEIESGEKIAVVEA